MSPEKGPFEKDIYFIVQPSIFRGQLCLQGENYLTIVGGSNPIGKYSSNILPQV